MSELQTVVENWGLVEYLEAQERQLSLVKKVQQDPLTQYLVFCTHPPVATKGRKTQASDLFAWEGPTVEVQRGGRVTYHGPNQLIAYPILHLDPGVPRKNLPARDLHGYLRNLELALLEVLSGYQIEAKNRPSDDFLSIYKDVEATGIWVGDRKLASIGIGVKKWVTFHGLAINLDRDEQAFIGMNPCGFKSSVVANLEELLGYQVQRDQFADRLKNSLKHFLS